MENGTNLGKPSWKQLGSLAGFIIEFLASLLNFSQVEYWLKNKKELKKKLREVFSIVDEFIDIREDWQNFYKTNFNWDVDFSGVIISTIPADGKWRLLFVSKWVTPSLAFIVCEKLFPSFKSYDNLEKEVSERNSGSHYAIWVRDEVEPDTECIGKVTDHLKIGITLLERILFEIKYFCETGNHLDKKGITFCFASRCLNGDVPVACWDGSKFMVVKHHSVKSGSSVGVRSVRL